MTSVFIGGSRAISRLDAAVREQLDRVVERGHPILIGDANGSDKAVQSYLAGRDYRNVTVFCTERCRNNLGNWPTRVVFAGPGVRGFAFYAAKDRAMASEAGCGIMLWDGGSRGTLENVKELLRSGKKVLLYASATRSFRKLQNEFEVSDLAAGTPAPPRRRSRGGSPATRAHSQLRLGSTPTSNRA